MRTYCNPNERNSSLVQRRCKSRPSKRKKCKSHVYPQRSWLLACYGRTNTSDGGMVHVPSEVGATVGTEICPHLGVRGMTAATPCGLDGRFPAQERSLKRLGGSTRLAAELQVGGARSASYGRHSSIYRSWAAEGCRWGGERQRRRGVGMERAGRGEGLGISSGSKGVAAGNLRGCDLLPCLHGEERKGPFLMGKASHRATDHAQPIGRPERRTIFPLPSSACVTAG
jgi:hypothetical protein